MAEVARVAMAPFKALAEKIAAAMKPKPALPKLSQAQAVKAVLASPILGLSGKPPRSIVPSGVPGPGPEWWQERERRRKAAEAAADKRLAEREQKEALERAKKTPGVPQETPKPDPGTDPDISTPGFRHKH